MTRINAPSSIGRTFAIMIGERVRQYLNTQQSTDNVYLVAVRAFHNARVYLGD